MDTRTKMGVLGDMNQYTRYQVATAIPEAASNPSGFAGMGAGMGAGVGMGMVMGNQMGSAMNSAVGTPPPVPKTSSYFVAIGGNQAGPFDMATLAGKIKSGDLKPATLVWKNGMTDWAAAESVAEIKDLFPVQPPPLPK